MFQTEASLVDHAVVQLESTASPFGFCVTASEFAYPGGRVDIVARAEDGCLVAFEAKLSKWRKALDQAHKHTTFAHYSYVLLPAETSRRAKSNASEFRRRGVGLCVDHGDVIVVDIPARPNAPLRPWLTTSATRFIQESGAGAASMV